jgi:Lysylphosphatidylglycerol synthase TM region
VLAYAAAELAAQIPFTLGGLGFVEAGLVGTLTLAGTPASAAVTATLLYRLVSYWLPIPAGGVAYLLFRRRYGSSCCVDPSSRKAIGISLAVRPVMTSFPPQGRSTHA